MPLLLGCGATILGYATVGGLQARLAEEGRPLAEEDLQEGYAVSRRTTYFGAACAGVLVCLGALGMQVTKAEER